MDKFENGTRRLKQNFAAFVLGLLISLFLTLSISYSLQYWDKTANTSSNHYHETTLTLLANLTVSEVEVEEEPVVKSTEEHHPIPNLPVTIENCLTQECHKASGEILSSLDISIDPCQNFYKFCCGGWLKTNKVPNGMHSWGIKNLVRNQLEEIVEAILEKPLDPTESYLDDVRQDFQECVQAFDKNQCSKNPAYIPYIFPSLIPTYFNESAEKETNEIAERVKRSLWKLFNGVEWLEKDNKAEALDKIVKMQRIIVYPEELKTYLKNKDPDSLEEGLDVLRQKNRNMSIVAFSLRSTGVRASYFLDDNFISISLGYTLPPFYTFGLPKHQNFASLGFIISHEMAHAFTQTGIDRFYNGKRRSCWLSKESQVEFEKGANCLSDQYSNFKFEEVGMRVNGEATLDENIADNVGIRVAFTAYKKAVEEVGVDKSLRGLEQFTPEQLFFLRYGYSRCESVTEDGLKKQLTEDNHAPAEVRVNGALRNYEEFSKAFNCPVKDEQDWMNPPPEKRCRIW